MRDSFAKFCPGPARPADFCPGSGPAGQQMRRDRSGLAAYVKPDLSFKDFKLR